MNHDTEISIDHDEAQIWQQAYDVLKPGECLFHECGNGEANEAWVQIRERARKLFEEADVENPFHPGARTS